MPLAGHNQAYFNLRQFHVAEFYTEPDSDSDVQEDAGVRKSPGAPLPGLMRAGE